MKLPPQADWNKLKELAREAKIPLHIMLGKYMTHEYDSTILEIQIETELYLLKLSNVYYRIDHRNWFDKL